MKRLVTLLALVACQTLQLTFASKLETGVPYFIRLVRDRKCGSDYELLGFYNRTCGSQPPREVGPSLRASSITSWSQWVFNITGESDEEQWGYIETYYPEKRGRAQCVGPLNPLNEDDCRGETSEATTIDPELGTSLFRFVPLKGKEATYRIILKDRSGRNCNRFLSASKDCSINTVSFVQNDGGGLQRWVITKVDSTDPSPSLPATESPPLPTTSTPSPTPSPFVIPAPNLTVSDISYTTMKASVSFADGFTLDSCNVELSPDNHSQSITVAEQSNVATAFFSGLVPMTTYTATVSCMLEDGTKTPESRTVSFTMLGESYDPPVEGESICDGLGETLSSNLSACICDSNAGYVGDVRLGCQCDAERNFVENDDGSCRCDSSSGYSDDGDGECKCDSSAGYIDDGDGGCQCDSSAGYIDAVDGGCQCDSNAGYGDDGDGGCSCDSSAGYIDDGDGACECDSSAGYTDGGAGGCECDVERRFVDAVDGGCQCDSSAGYTNDGEGGCSCDSSAGYTNDGEGGCECDIERRFVDAVDGGCECDSNAGYIDDGEGGCKPDLFYLADNGVTVLCPQAQVGSSGVVNQVTYTKRTKDQITTTNGPTTCTSGITDMADLFYWQKPVNVDLSHWDTSSVTTMASLFRRTDFNQDISKWDTSSVTTMDYMFSVADFNQDISDWDTSLVTNMEYMFDRNGNFNQDIGDWDTSSVANMKRMFNGADSFNQYIGGWNTGSVTNMEYMFNEAPEFNQDISAWDVSSVTDMDYMFAYAESFNQDLSGWCVGKVTSYSDFSNDAGFANLPAKHPKFGSSPC